VDYGAKVSNPETDTLSSWEKKMPNRNAHRKTVADFSMQNHGSIFLLQTITPWVPILKPHGSIN
jgi:hypothetical protein